MTFEKVRKYLRDNVVRVYGLAVSLMALVAFYAPGLPSDLVLGVVGAILALFGGEAVQRVENRKSIQAQEYGRDEMLDAL